MLLCHRGPRCPPAAQPLYLRLDPRPPLRGRGCGGAERGTARGHARCPPPHPSPLASRPQTRVGGGHRGDMCPAPAHVASAARHALPPGPLPAAARLPAPSPCDPHPAAPVALLPPPRPGTPLPGRHPFSPVPRSALSIRAQPPAGRPFPGRPVQHPPLSVARSPRALLQASLSHFPTPPPSPGALRPPPTPLRTGQSVPSRGRPGPRADSPRPCDAGRDRSASGTNALSGHLSGGARGGRLGTFRSRRGAGPRCGREGAGGAASASGPRDVGSRWSWVAAPLPPQPPPGDGARLPRCQGLPLTAQQEVDAAGGLQGFPGVGSPGVNPVPLACSLRAARLEQSQHNSCRGHRQEPTPTAPPAPCPGLPERERAPGPSRGVLVWIQRRGRSASGSLTPSAHGDTAKDSPMPAPSIFSKRPNKPCLPAGLLGTALRQGPGHGGQTAQQSQRTRGGLTDGPLFTALPPPQTWAYPLALPYLAPMQALFPAVSMGGGGEVCV